MLEVFLLQHIAESKHALVFPIERPYYQTHNCTALYSNPCRLEIYNLFNPLRGRTRLRLYLGKNGTCYGLCTWGASPICTCVFCLVSQSCLRWRITSSFSSWSQLGFNFCKGESDENLLEQALCLWQPEFSLLRLPELVRKYLPAHYHSAGRGIFEWPALLWVGTVLWLWNKQTGFISVNKWCEWESERLTDVLIAPSIRSQSLCRSCIGQASHSLIWVLELCNVTAVLKACFIVSITSSTWQEDNLITITPQYNATHIKHTKVFPFTCLMQILCK